ncbi:LacI family DNA-binding transcriptional regulator [Cellulomonas sp. URHE0023]|uniref:LacI family DNA-binding transcriptional regulator n=1 Tax=Cellulomonas sp. URHE0023 TaxID=1380354 RepID=UPI0004890C2D|nr:LacI family DNA-binding transcriptional regulator [Cellulomonas sp. URHE0023]
MATGTQGRAPRRASVVDVARLAQVSVGTVSNVLNRPDHVASATRDRVLAAIEELQFVRNASARQLRAGTLQSIGVVLLDIANPFFTAVARGIEDRLALDEYTLMLSSSDEKPEREARYLRLFEEHGVQGVMVTPSSAASLETLLVVRERGIDTVLLDATSPLDGLSSVAVDDVRGGALAVEHLVAMGHTRIAFLNGPLGIRQCADRREGVLAALAAAGLDPGEALVELTIPTLNAEGGALGAERLMSRGSDGAPITATFCVNDFTALGALRALRRAGVSIPRDMAVVGYDDVDFAPALMVPLTSVRQPTHKLGFTAADLLLRHRTEGSDYVHQQIQFQPELVVRTSSDPSVVAG